jgi:hypothetical protein
MAKPSDPFTNFPAPHPLMPSHRPTTIGRGRPIGKGIFWMSTFAFLRQAVA